MKNTRLISKPHIGNVADPRISYLHSVAPRVGVHSAPIRLQQALTQLEELQHELASGREVWAAARQQVARLSEANARLRQLATQREQEVAKVRHFAYHDELTGLPNRSLLLDRLNQALARAKRQRKQLALLLLDLDGFKAINDRLGHAAGDKLLRGVAERLQSCIRGGDTACRYGGDEFVLLLPEVDDEQRALDVAQKIHVHLAASYVVDDQSITVTASIGVAVSALHGVTQQDLLKQADVAMYLAKTIQSSSTAKIKVALAR